MIRRTSLAALALLAAAPAHALPVPVDDPILFWNDIALQNFGGAAPVQTRAYAMMNVAMHDAVVSVTGSPRQTYLQRLPGVGGDPRAAASQAARNVLVALDPGNTAKYDAALAQSLAGIADGPARVQGASAGAGYADAILFARMGDGANATIPYTPSGLPGGWAPTPPGNAPAALPHWGKVTPFVMSAGDQFRPAPPPALDSAEYAFALNEVRALGSATGSIRTADQTDSALFWSAANGAQWLRIGVTIAEGKGRSFEDNARTMALLTTALADTQIAGFDAKYTFDRWRPVTAIRQAGLDGNPLTEADPFWTPLNAAPAHPSYVSTLSALSGAGLTTLTAMLGDDTGFCLTIGARQRCFDSMAAAALDASNSRLWGGIHFSFDNQAGLQLGRDIAQLGLGKAAFNAVPEPETWALMIAGFGLTGAVARRSRPRVIAT